MRIREGSLEGVFEIELVPHVDDRGFFMRVYDEHLFRLRGIARHWVQESHSFSREKGTVRGLHFQYPPHTETKMVRVVRGEVYVVFVDLRGPSAGCGRWGSAVLSETNHRALYVSRGFALGMCTVSDDCHVCYRMDACYAPSRQAAIRWDDPDLRIDWPVERPSRISPRDAHAMSFREFVARHGGLRV